MNTNDRQETLSKFSQTMTDPVIARDSLARIAVLVGGKRCPRCGTKLDPHVDSYDHPGGYDLAGFGEKQWVYAHCEGCHTDVALPKLKVAVD